MATRTFNTANQSFITSPTPTRKRRGKATAPGQVKKRMGLKSAKSVAPGQRKKARSAPGPGTSPGVVATPYASKVRRTKR